jgi:hypothetical protein
VANKKAKYENGVWLQGTSFYFTKGIYIQISNMMINLCRSRSFRHNEQAVLHGKARTLLRDQLAHLANMAGYHLLFTTLPTVLKELDSRIQGLKTHSDCEMHNIKFLPASSRRLVFINVLTATLSRTIHPHRIQTGGHKRTNSSVQEGHRT